MFLPYFALLVNSSLGEAGLSASHFSTWNEDSSVKLVVEVYGSSLWIALSMAVLSFLTQKNYGLAAAVCLRV